MLFMMVRSFRRIICEIARVAERFRLWFPASISDKDYAPVQNRKVLRLPIAFAFALLALGLATPVRQNHALLWTFMACAFALLGWTLFLYRQSRTRGRQFTLEVMLRKQHYMQAGIQGSVFLYWGWYWPQVYAVAPLILAQLLFAYAFDMLLVWSRRDQYSLGFSPFPVVFSINLFLWFKPDWFYFQFLIVALGFMAKEFLRWNKDGRNAHIFNPSSFPLAVFSVILLVTGTTDLTWGKEIASTQFYPPHMYLVLFLLGMPGQFFFGVTLMTMSAVVATYVFGLAYFASTGIYFFYDSYIPISVFLGMHLLFTDPATAPRTELGRIFFGVLYGLSTVLLYQLLGSMGMPTFYDKLLQVPFLNLSIKGIDRLARSRLLSFFDPASLGRKLAPRYRHLAFMSIWAVVFVAMSAAQGVGDNHPGQWLPFWQQACDENRAYACPYLADLQSMYCDQGSGYACNEAGVLYLALLQSGEDTRRTSAFEAAQLFKRGCEIGSQSACANLDAIKSGRNDFVHGSPALADYPIILKGSKGEIIHREPSDLYALACREGFPDACGKTAAVRH